MSDSQPIMSYTVGWICALEIELVAATAFFDEEHEGLDYSAPNDNNTYSLGNIGNHNVVIAVLPQDEPGTNAAAAVARDMLRTFPNIRIGLMVGIGGGVPSEENDIRLGDIVVSSRDRDKGGVVQYDYGKAIQDAVFQQTGSLNQPPQLLLTAVSSLKAKYRLKGHQLNTAVADIFEKWPRLRSQCSRPHSNSDRLYRYDFVHQSSAEGCNASCGNDPADLVNRRTRGEYEDNPAIHYGLIASANKVMKDARVRDKLGRERGVLCFEMEAAGLMNHFPCLVIRGICDYSDSHKNSEWQGFAAMMAAAYAKDLLGKIQPSKVEAERPMKEQLDSIKKGIEYIGEKTTDLESAQHDQKIREWLHPPEASNLNDARHLRQEGTGQWFLDSVPFREWERGSRQHIWLYGISGSGKTILSSTIIDYLVGKSDGTVLNFFFDFTDASKQTVDGMARSLLFQLYRLGKSQINVLFKAHQDGRNQPGTRALLDTLSSVLRAQDKVYIVLDAMDECSARNELLKSLEDFLFLLEPKQVKMILTGRPEAEFWSMDTLIGTENCILLEKSGINTDIRSYIKSKLCQSDFERWTSRPDIQEKILEEVGTKADGMFRLAACQLKILEDCFDQEGIETALKNLPRDLGKTYDRMMERIPAASKKKAHRLLQFLISVERPLTLKEAVDVVAVRADEKSGYFKIADRMPDAEDIIRLCPSLVSVVSQSRPNRWSFKLESVKELHLSHLSVKEYLLERSGPSQKLFEEKAAVTITRICFIYLRGLSPELEKKGIRLIERFFFARTAATLWIRHAAAAEDSDDIVESNVDFLTNRTTFRVWSLLYEEEQRRYMYRTDCQAPYLYYACLGGLRKTVDLILRKGAVFDAEGHEYNNALQAASLGGHLDIIRILLEKGADINAESDKCQCLLQGHACGKRGRYGNALYFASSEGHTDIVRWLLENGADPNAYGGERNGQTNTALLIALDNGHLKIVKMLLEKGADANAYCTAAIALLIASTWGYTEILQLLLEKGVDIDARDQKGTTALQAASRRGDIQTVQFLLEKGADINAQDREGTTALQAASRRGDIQTVQFLLEKGADINAQDREGTTALQAASRRGDIQTVQFLLEKGADIYIQGIEYGNALQAASEGGDQEIIQLLFGWGASLGTSESSATSDVDQTEAMETTEKRERSPSYESDSKRSRLV